MVFSDDLHRVESAAQNFLSLESSTTTIKFYFITFVYAFRFLYLLLVMHCIKALS